MTAAGDEFRRIRDSLHELMVVCDAAVSREDAIDDREQARADYQARMRRMGDHLRHMRLVGDRGDAS